jgi:hypothetical protein
MIGFLTQIIVEWWKQSQVAKGAVTVAMGSSFGFVAMMGLMKEQIAEVNASTDAKVLALDKKVFDFAAVKGQMRDEQFRQIHEELKYQRGAIDATNQNVLDVLKEIKKK